MGYTLKSPATEQEWYDYYQLRWQILRAPWQQPLGSERDEFENEAFHIMAIDNQNNVSGVGRLHRLSNSNAQIRYMAVLPQHQGKGIGGQILQRLEKQARDWGCQEILLNARTTSLDFYLRHGYQITGEAPMLFGSIAHKQMHKFLS
jgi:N-acetylglutamate synthase-like GNAT family acetyltransferase